MIIFNIIFNIIGVKLVKNAKTNSENYWPSGLTCLG